MIKIGTPESPVRVAIVGAGPSGFYAAEHILKGEDVHAQVDLFDRLPTPFGLVRGGVAPDHPKIKSVIRVYEKTAAREGFRFFGNVKVGHDIEVEDLERLYHAIVFTVGCETDRQLGIPGEELPGSHAATAFVGWYNAHPDYADDDFDLSCERAVVIGNGNVAMDVARMLALTDHELRQTDTADHAIELLDAKRIREIVVLGRRGPVQAAFTNPEIKELGEMEDAPPARPTSSPRMRTRRPGSTSRRCVTSPSANPRAGASESCCASSPRRLRSRATARSRRS
jgi:ferredoxin--NADP+ reductase